MNFGGDPFDPFGTRRQMRQMEQMMDSMMGDPFSMMDNFFPSFGNPRMGMLEDSGNRSRRSQNHNNQVASPFGFGGGMFGNLMQQMQMMEHGAVNNPHSHVFTQSTMISYDGNGAPKVVQNSVTKTGDVKETRRTVRHGDREEVTVNHAIGDRAHEIKKKRDADGRVRKSQRFVNLDEDEAEQFNHEFKTRAHRNLNGFTGEFASGSRNNHHAIENGRSSLPTDTMEHSGHSRRSTKKDPQPIVEIPDDDSDIEILEEINNKDRVTYSNSHRGPRITEVDDTTEVGASSKRRKGMFGKFFATDD